MICLALFVLPKLGTDDDGGDKINPSGTAAIAEEVIRTRAEILRDTYAEAAAKVSGGNIKHATDLAAAIEAGVDKANTGSTAKFSEHAAASLPDSKIEDPKATAAWLKAVSEGFGRVAE